MISDYFLEQGGGGGSPSPCMNGGTFKTLQNKCECEPEFTGRNCETGQFTKNIYINSVIDISMYRHKKKLKTHLFASIRRRAVRSSEPKRESC